MIIKMYEDDSQVWAVNPNDPISDLQAAPDAPGIDLRASEDVQEMAMWWNRLNRTERLDWVEYAEKQNPGVQRVFMQDYAWAEYKRLNSLEDAYSKESDFED